MSLLLTEVGTTSGEGQKMASDAQNKATNKYRREKVKQIILRFFPKDEELYVKAKALGSTGIKELIAKHK